MIINYCSKPKGSEPAPVSGGIPVGTNVLIGTRYIPCDYLSHANGTTFQYIALHPTQSLWNGSKIVDESIGLSIISWEGKSQLKVDYGGKTYYVRKRNVIKLPEPVTLTSNVQIADDGPIILSSDYIDTRDIQVLDSGVLGSPLVTLAGGAKFQYLQYQYTNLTSSDVQYSSLFNMYFQPYYKKATFAAGDSSSVDIEIPNLNNNCILKFPKPITLPTDVTVQSSANTAMKASMTLLS